MLEQFIVIYANTAQLAVILYSPKTRAFILFRGEFFGRGRRWSGIKQRSLISNGRAIPFTAHAAAPTVTMPRVKALTTGSIPSFLDVILNIAESDTSSSLASQDTWLAQIRARGGKLTMFGDDTWLKLFPGMFERSDGTASFFVSVCRSPMPMGNMRKRKANRPL